MPGVDAFKVEASVIAVHANRTCLVGLANGHRLTAFVTSRNQVNVGRLEPGNRVRLQLTPFDLSVGRVLEKVAS
jgi:translation initiation factor IF-1